MWSLRKWVRGRIRNWRFDGAGQSLGGETGEAREPKPGWFEMQGVLSGKGGVAM